MCMYLCTCVKVYVYAHMYVYIYIYVYDLPQWFHVFCYVSYKYIHIHLSHHESSQTQQHSNWNCVGANRPQHSHMYGHIVCD